MTKVIAMSRIKSHLFFYNVGYTLSYMATLASRIRQRMADLDITQDELAKKVGHTQPAISKILNGKTLEPKRINLIAIVLDTSVEWLMTGRGPPMRKNDVGKQPAGYVGSDLTAIKLSNLLKVKKLFHKLAGQGKKVRYVEEGGG